MEQASIILQARMGSARLPGKVIRTLAGIPLLSHCIRRLSHVGPVIVATSGLARDDQVEDLARDEGVHCFRGSEEDVIDRFYATAKAYELKYIMRATGDNPLVDPHEAKRVMAHMVNNNVDYVTGIEIVDGMGLPVGVGVEAFAFEALERSWHEATEKEQREHVNEYILHESNSFVIFRLKCLAENSCPDLRLTVDTSNDLAFIEQILADVGQGRAPWEVSTRQIIEWWKKRSSGLS